MRNLLTGVAVLALASGAATAATAMPMHSMMHSTMMPSCTDASGPVVWYVASRHHYYTRASKYYGKGNGMYVCRANARGMMHGMGGMHGGMMHGGSMHGGSMHGGSMSGGMHPPSGGTQNKAGSSASGSMNGPGTSGGTMAPGSMGTPGSMSTTPPSGSQQNTGGTGTGGTMSSPNPTASGSMMNGSMGNASGNQGNTGAPGAGGQTPNNPASSTNNASPAPRPPR